MTAGAPLIETVAEDPRWHAAGLEALASAACAAALAGAGLVPRSWEISVLGCDDARIAALNGDFRKKPQPTNVLSWPAEDLSPERPGGAPRAPAPEDPMLGNIAISYDTCAREAAEAGRSFAAHVSHLLVHGTLHLLGFDHIDDKDAVKMEALEIAILASMGIDDPY
ncbi:MAG: rRNA maturation RNase YbeY [Alphaproteobacteria bacterium]|nr:rRNA maturation RNase YbeY [Alphaproteobacteria bacterium]NNF24066.1 rRNA maturation RNase YbeY [Paracoccaceae bacterium]